ncbi:MAG TPA: alpha/beta hydrolase [Bacteroidia bacterium]|jgi:hypothetical protein|nr:alpha/beta hydrolase [Bacteroidia bacterium]
MNFLKKYLFTGLFLFYILISNAQSSGYTYCDWDRIKLDTKYIPNEIDTAIIFVSTRNYFPDKPEFFDYDLDTTHALHYFAIYFNHNNWICVPKQDLQDALRDVSKRDIVVYTEGMGKTFPANIDRATRFTRLYNVVTIMFDWPTYRPYLSGGKNYKLARRQSKTVARSLSKLFSELDKYKASREGTVKMSLLFHSLGNRIIKEAVTNDFIEVKDKLFDNIILNAPCVKMRGHKKWLEKLNIQKQIFVTRNNHDRTLELARLAGFTKQLGMHNRWRKADNAIYLNFSKVLEKEHNYFLMNNVLRSHPNIKALYNDMFHAKPILFDDEKKFKQRKKNVITLIQPYFGEDGDVGISLTL